MEKQKLRRWEDGKVSRAQSAWGIGLKADVGRRPPARRGIGAYAPEGRWKNRSWEDEKVGKSKTGGWGDRELKGSMHSKPIIGSISEPRAAD